MDPWHHAFGMWGAAAVREAWLREAPMPDLIDGADIWAYCFEPPSLAALRAGPAPPLHPMVLEATAKITQAVAAAVTRAVTTFAQRQYWDNESWAMPPAADRDAPYLDPGT